MKPRPMAEDVFWVGAVDWDRRLFDSLIPLPDGTSYNAYLVRGSEKTVLLDTVDPAMTSVLMSRLQDTPSIDFVVSHHAEQDHSGSIPVILEKYPGAKVICTPTAKNMLIDHLLLKPEQIRTVEDGETLSLGDKSLRFIHTPWVHWPETMSSYLGERKILFSCDFFGSHLATEDLFVNDDAGVYPAAKRYYAELMMPFRRIIEKNLEKIKGLEIGTIAPSHGPSYPRPKFIIDCYRDWGSDATKNVVVIPYVTMHGSTARMVEYLAAALADKGIEVQLFNLPYADVGKVAMSLVDAATMVVGAPAVHVGPHPAVLSALHLANALRPKLRFFSILGSYGWGNKIVEQIRGMIPNLKVEMLNPILAKGFPKEQDFRALDDLSESILKKHKDLGVI